MSLVALTHRRLATVSASAMTVAAVLDAFWAAVDPAVTTYSDGSTRSFSGAGATGWTWTRVQVGGVTEALYATPPGGSMAQRVVIAGRSATPTPSPVMLAPEAFTASTLLLGHALGAGAFTTWNAASPFTSGRWSGYTRSGTVITTMSTIAVCVYETQETIWIEQLYNGTLIPVACAGALYDPETVAAATCETDGRRYGIITSGGALVANFLGTGSAGTLWAHATGGSGSPHGYIWRPGSTVIDVVARQWASLGSATAVHHTNLAGEFAGDPLFIPSTTGWVGRVREVSWTRPVLYHQRIEPSPGVTTAYGISSSTTTASGDSLFLKY